MNENQNENTCENDLVLKQKLAYLCGNALSNATKKSKMKLRRILETRKDQQVVIKSENLKRSLLMKLRITEAEAKSGKYAEIYNDVDDKQYDSRGLTYINEDLFDFFEVLYKKVKKYNNCKYIQYHADDYFTAIMKEVQDDENLINNFINTCDKLDVEAVTDILR